MSLFSKLSDGSKAYLYPQLQPSFAVNLPLILNDQKHICDAIFSCLCSLIYYSED